MSRPYKIRGKGYEVPTQNGYHICRSRLQAGVVYTKRRTGNAVKGRPMQDPPNYASSLLFLRGTTDELSAITAGYRPKAKRDPCPCCDAPGRGRYRLTEYGRQRLNSLRKRKGIPCS